MRAIQGLLLGFLIVSVVCMAMPAQARADQLLVYNFTTNNAPSTVAAGVDGPNSKITTGTFGTWSSVPPYTGGVSTSLGAGGDDGPDSSGGGTSGQSYLIFPGSTGSTGYSNSTQALAAQCYFTFSVSATSGNVLNLTSLQGDWALGNNDARGFAVLACTDGVNYVGYNTLSDNPASASHTTPSLDVTLISGHNEPLASELDTTDLTGLSGSTIYFKVPVWNNSTQANGRDIYVDNLVLNGTVTPEPATLALLLAGGAALLRRRRGR